MLSQIIRFTLPSSCTASSLKFLKLRQRAASAGAFAQYFGYSIATKVLALPRERHEVCWVIRTCRFDPSGTYSSNIAGGTEWPESSNRSQIITELDTVSAGDARVLTLRFTDDQIPELTKALEAPVCEFVSPRVSGPNPINQALNRSKGLHQTLRRHDAV